MMTDQERAELAFAILDNCRLHDTDGSLVLLEVDKKLWEAFNAPRGVYIEPDCGTPFVTEDM
jgi:hypothetical protein